MKIVSWNLNGLSSCIQNNSFAPIADIGPDILCLQEIRTQQEPQILPGYQHCWNHGQRNGYAGTAVLYKKESLSVSFGLGDDDADEEGRTIILEYKGFYLINAYVPNSQKNLIRHAYRLEWDQLLIDRVSQLRELKPVIVCGDFNVARAEIDIYPENMRQYWAGLGYASDERSDMETLIELGLVDAFRELNPDIVRFGCGKMGSAITAAGQSSMTSRGRPYSSTSEILPLSATPPISTRSVRRMSLY